MDNTTIHSFTLTQHLSVDELDDTRSFINSPFFISSASKRTQCQGTIADRTKGDRTARSQTRTDETPSPPISKEAGIPHRRSPPWVLHPTESRLPLFCCQKQAALLTPAPESLPSWARLTAGSVVSNATAPARLGAPPPQPVPAVTPVLSRQDAGLHFKSGRIKLNSEGLGGA